MEGDAAAAASVADDSGGQQRRKGKGGKGKGGNKGGGGGKGHRERAEKGSQSSHHGEGHRGGGGGSRKGGGKSRDSGGGDHGGGSGGKGPITLGEAPLVAIEGAPSVLGTKSVHCLLCASDSPSYVALGSCGHTDACWVCCLRLRSLARDYRCPVCKEDLEEVLITNEVSAPFDKGDLAGLPRDSSIGVYFSDARIKAEASLLFQYQCSLDRCEGCVESCFRTLRELENHLWYTHWQQFCRTCLYGRPAFLCEQHVYGCRELDHHNCYGDPGRSTGYRPTPPVPPHPPCEFCRTRLYNEDELVRHMHKKHHLCHICEKLGRRNEFYSTWKCLALHYQESHHVCAHKDCIRGGYRLIAFAEEEELNLHYLTEHKDESRMSDRERKQGMRLAVGQSSYADESSSRHERGKGRGKGASSADAADVVVRFMWPPGATSEHMQPDDSNAGVERDQDSDREDTYERYPKREVLKDASRRRGSASSAEAISTEEGADGVDEEGDGDADKESAEAYDSPPSPGYGDVPLHPKLEALDIDCTVASHGPRQGNRSCLSALYAVLCCMVPDQNDREAEARFKSVVATLTPTEVEGLERMRAHLDDGSRMNANIDWTPLERVLALRPKFFLLAVSPQQTAKRAIGPRAGANTPEAKNWGQWKAAAQQALEALSAGARQRLRTYVQVCTQRRSELSAIIEQSELEESFPTLGGPGAGGGSGNEVPPRPQEGQDSAQFPTLPEGAAPDSERPAVAGPGAGWGRQKQVLPGSQGKTVSEEFPTLGGGPRGGGQAEAKWGASSGAVRASVREAPPLPADEPATMTLDEWSRSSKPKEPQTPADYFPSLGGSSSQVEREPQWGAAVRSRKEAAAAAAKMPPAAPEPPPKPKKFELECEAPSFPGLPTAAPKPPSKMAKAAAKEKAAAVAAKAKGKAKAAAVAPVSPAASQWDRKAEEEELEPQYIPGAPPPGSAQGGAAKPKASQSLAASRPAAPPTPAAANGGTSSSSSSTAKVAPPPKPAPKPAPAAKPSSALTAVKTIADAPLDDFFPGLISDTAPMASKVKGAPVKGTAAAAQLAAKRAARAAPKARPSAAPADIEEDDQESVQLASMDELVLISKKDDDEEGDLAAGKKGKVKANRQKKVVVPLV